MAHFGTWQVDPLSACLRLRFTLPAKKKKTTLAFDPSAQWPTYPCPTVLTTTYGAKRCDGKGRRRNVRSRQRQRERWGGGKEMGEEKAEEVDFWGVEHTVGSLKANRCAEASFCIEVAFSHIFFTWRFFSLLPFSSCSNRVWFFFLFINPTRQPWR